MNKKHLHSIAACSDLLAIRKAALLAHWVPNLSLVMRRSDRPALLVTVDQQLDPTGCSNRIHPCAFRHEVHLLMQGRSELLGKASQLGLGTMQLEIITTTETRFEDSGLVGASFHADHSMVGYVTTTATSTVGLAETTCNQSCTWEINETPPLNAHQDDELGLTLVTCSYLTTDIQRAERAYAAVLDAMVTAATEEFLMVVAS